MITRTLEQVAAMSSAELSIPEAGQQFIEGVTIDTRSIKGKELFVPLTGSNTDGHQFVQQAFEKGVAAAFWKRGMPNPPAEVPLLFVEDPLEAMQQLAKRYRQETDVIVVGVTGSNGKTTTKDMIAQILAGTFSVQKTIGNYNNHLGLPLSLFNLDEETEVIVLEMGMSARGEIELLSQIAQPNIAVISNIGEAHLQDLGSREGIAEAKLEIIAGLKGNGLFIYDGDEPLLKERIDPNWPFKLVSFGKSERNGIYPISVEAKGTGTEMVVQAFPDTPIFLPVMGLHNVKNALAAIAVARFLQVDASSMKKQLEKLSLSKMRMETKKGQKGSLIINDAYNASPTSMRAAIEFMHSLEGYSKKVLVLGDMLELGPNEIEFHREIGQFISGDHIQYVFTYGPLASRIASEVKKNSPLVHVKEYSSKKALINDVLSLLDGQTVVLAKASRGMKLEEVVEALL